MNSTAQNLPALARAVLVTLAYTDQFEFPLTSDEVLLRCLRQELTMSTLTRKEVKDSLQLLKKKNLIEEVGTYYALHGRADIIKTRLEKETHAAAKNHEVQRVVSFLKRLPWTRAVYLTGSQAMNCADLQSDIDFMIITAPRRLWLTRILVSCFAQLQGRRRSWNREEPGSWCFNLWLDSEHVTVDPSKQDSYRAYEVLQAKSLWAKDDFDVEFAQKNAWLGHFFFLKTEKKKSRKTSEQLEQNDAAFLAPFFDGLDWLAWVGQAFYMRRHQTTEKVGRGFAFFHPRDTRKIISDGWLHSLERCLPKSQAVAILQPYVTR